MNVSEIIISNRTRQKADDLKSQFKFINVIDWGNIPKFDMIINATSLGLNNEALNLNFSEDVMEFISKRTRRDFSSIKRTIQDLEKFLYSEKKEPTKKTVSSFFSEYKN